MEGSCPVEVAQPHTALGPFPFSQRCFFWNNTGRLPAYHAKVTPIDSQQPKRFFLLYLVVSPRAAFDEPDYRSDT